MRLQLSARTAHHQLGMTLAEVIVSLGVGGLLFGGIITGYMQSANQAEWSAYQLAGHSLAAQRLEAARAAKWDTQSYPPVDQLVGKNFPPMVDVLDVPVGGGTPVEAATQVYIDTVSTQPPLKMIRAEAVWSFRGQRQYTNTIVTYRAPDQ